MKNKLLYILLFICSISYAQIPTTNLVGHYDFSNGGLTDNIISANFIKIGTAATTITDRFGNANEAISLNGDDLRRGDINFNLTNSTPFLSQTISFWVKTATNDANTRIIYNDNDQISTVDTAFDGMRVYLQNGQISAAFRDSAYHGNYITHTTNVSDNVWHHVVIQASVTNTSGTKRIITHVYIDTVKEGGTTLLTANMNSTGPNHSGNISFSRLKGVSVASNEKYQDGLDEVLFYTRILSDAEVSSIYDCTINIPDANFKNYLVGNTAINTNGDTEIQCSEATAFTGIMDINNKNISDITGIEAFTEITELKCNGNNLSTIDVSFNTKITLLNIASNQLTTLDLSTNTVLNTLWAQANQFSSLDLSGYASLNFIVVHTNPLLSSLNVANGNNSNIPSNSFSTTSTPNLTCITVDNVTYSTANWTFIDAQTSFSTNCPPCIVNIPDANFKNYLVGNTAINTNGDTEIQCTEATAFIGLISCSGQSISDLTGLEAFINLTELHANDNQLTSIDISNNTVLETLFVSLNNLTTLDVSSNLVLERLSLFSNSLTSLDISTNSVLTSLIVPQNNLTSLNVANGNNSNFSNFEANNNPNLTCIQVDDVAYSTTNWTNIDAQTSFGTNCTPCVVSIPDANFKNYLVGNTAINTNGDTEIQCAEATAFTGGVYCINLSISDLTGIEAFTSITELYCNDNSLTSLDVSANTALTKLICRNNLLTSLDLSINTSLNYLECQVNNLTSLNIANGNNSLMGSGRFFAATNSNLTCIQVDNEAFSLANWTNSVDAGVNFSTDCAALSINDFTLQNISIYPNPVNKTLNIQLEETLEKVEVYSILGKKVLKSNTNTNVDVSKLSPGMYLLKVYTEDGKVGVKRFIKQ
ncbi:MAG: T9SS type A sorting domain-containing protein [Algibacter sp.]